MIIPWRGSSGSSQGSNKFEASVQALHDPLRYLVSVCGVQRAVTLSALEQAEYLRCHKAASDQYQRYRHAGVQCINRHILALVGLLHPLRLICSGGALRPMARSQPAVYELLGSRVQGSIMACCTRCASSAFGDASRRSMRWHTLSRSACADLPPQRCSCHIAGRWRLHLLPPPLLWRRAAPAGTLSLRLPYTGRQRENAADALLQGPLVMGLCQVLSRSAWCAQHEGKRPLDSGCVVRRTSQCRSCPSRTWRTARRAPSHATTSSLRPTRTARSASTPLSGQPGPRASTGSACANPRRPCTNPSCPRAVWHRPAGCLASAQLWREERNSCWKHCIAALEMEATELCAGPGVLPHRHSMPRCTPLNCS